MEAVAIKQVENKDIIWNYAGTVFNMGIGVLMLPFLLLLDDDTLGLWYVMVSFSSIANLFTFGFTPALARNVNYSWNGAVKLEKSGKADNTERMDGVNYALLHEILSASKIIYFVIALLAVIVIGTYGTWHISRVAADILSDNIWASWFVFLAAIFLNIYYGYYNSFLIGIGKVKEANQALVLAGCIRIGLMALLMGLGFGLLGASVSYLCYGVALRTICRRKFYQADENIGKRDIYEDKSERNSKLYECVKIVWHNAWRDGAVSLGDYLQTQAGTLVCSYLLSLSETAVYSLTAQIVGTIGKVGRSIYNAHTPVVQGAYITDDKETLRKTQGFCVFMYVIVYAAGIFALITVGVPLIGWIKPSVNITRPFIGIYAVYQFMLSYRNCYGAYLSCTNRLFYWKSYLITGAATVLAYTIILWKFHLGMWGIVCVSIVMEGIYNFWKWPSLVKKELNLKMADIICYGIARCREGLRFK